MVLRDYEALLTQNDFLLQNLYEKLDDKDKELFYFDMEELNWRDFIGQSMLGIRTYLMKEDPKNIPEARKRFHRWVLRFKLKVAKFGLKFESKAARIESWKLSIKNDKI